MQSLYTALVVFVCIFGGALIGLLLGRFLPDNHLSDGGREIIKEARSIVTGVAALTLGLLVASAKSAFDAKSADLKTSAAKMILLDRTLEKIGPAADAPRQALREVVRDGVRRIDTFSKEDVLREHRNRTSLLDALQNGVLALAPQGERQSWLKSSALSIVQDIVQARWSIYQGLESTLQPAFLAMLTFWLSSILFSLGIVSPLNSSVTTALLLASASLAGAVFLTLELDQPYGGLIRISSAPFRAALDQLSAAPLAPAQ